MKLPPHPPPRNRRPGLATALILLLLALVGADAGFGQRIEDDFDDGNDDGWTRLDPLADFGVSADFTFPGGNSLRVATSPSPDPAGLGASRAGLMRGDADFGAFRLAIDIVDWDPSVSQDAGLLARLSNVGLGTTDGYAWSLEFPSGLYLSLLTGEAPTTLGQADFTPVDGSDYRLVFHGFGGDLLGQCFDLADPQTPVAEVYAWDPSYESGPPGIFVNAARNTDGTDATFDRFRADAEPDTDSDGLPDPWEQAQFGNLLQDARGDADGDQADNGAELAAGTSPTDAASRFRILSVAVEGDELLVDFTLTEERDYTLERSSDGAEWDLDPGAALSSDGDRGRFVTATDDVLDFGFVRVRVVRP